MGGMLSEAVMTVEVEAEVEEEDFSREQVQQWREAVALRREELFHRNWKNERPLLRLKSRDEAASFQFLLEWCDEFGDVVGREQERSRLDKLIAIGVDVNLPREEQPRV